jgi:hypothetical protein
MLTAITRPFRRTLSTAAAVAVAVAGLVTAAPAMASDSRTVTVNATVIGVCKFFTASPVLNISNTGSGSDIDPSSSTLAEGSVPIKYRCTNGQAPTFTVDSNITLNNGGDSMVATITYTGGGNGTGMGSSQDKTLTVSGSIASTIFEDKPIGLYTNTMTVGINP